MFDMELQKEANEVQSSILKIKKKLLKKEERALEIREELMSGMTGRTEEDFTEKLVAEIIKQSEAEETK